MDINILQGLLATAGGLCFMASGIPMAWAAHKQGIVVGIPPSTMWCVFSGAILMISYILWKYGFDIFLTFEYLTTATVWATILRYHYFPREDNIVERWQGFLNDED